MKEGTLPHRPDLQVLPGEDQGFLQGVVLPGQAQVPHAFRLAQGEGKGPELDPSGP